MSVSASLIFTRDATVLGTVYVAHDITERKRSEEQLRSYSEELQQSNDDIKSFAYIVSHDLRAPLVSIKGFTSELQYSLKEIDGVLQKCMTHLGDEERAVVKTVYESDVAEAVKFINSSVTRMDGLISAVLNLSRLGRQALKFEPVSMSEIVSSILNSLAHQIEQHRVAVTVNALPMIVADKVSMEQIMGNLMDNALKYLVPGRAGTISITSEQTADQVIFHISDNGRGIAQDDFHKVFELFRRAGRQDVPGEGMGLAYVKTLVRRHGGRIWCESELGKGTTFSFMIPRGLESPH